MYFTTLPNLSCSIPVYHWESIIASLLSMRQEVGEKPARQMVGEDLMPLATWIWGDLSKTTWPFPAFHIEETDMSIQWENCSAPKFPHQGSPRSPMFTQNFSQNRQMWPRMQIWAKALMPMKLCGNVAPMNKCPHFTLVQFLPVNWQILISQ